MLVPDIGTEYVGEIVRGVGDALEQSAFDLLLYTTHRDPERERKRLHGVAGGMADGLLTVLPRTIDSHLKMLENLALPVVIVDHRGANTSLPTIGTDNVTGARQAVQHLAELGAPPHRFYYRRLSYRRSRRPFARLPRGVARGWPARR